MCKGWPLALSHCHIHGISRCSIHLYQCICAAKFMQPESSNSRHIIHRDSRHSTCLSCFYSTPFMLAVSCCLICAIALKQQLSYQHEHSSTGAARLTQQHLLCHIHAAAFTPPHSYSTHATAFTPEHFYCSTHTAALMPPNLEQLVFMEGAGFKKRCFGW